MDCQSIKRSPPNSIYPLLDKTSAELVKGTKETSWSN
jgi:hypothetical protein